MGTNFMTMFAHQVPSEKGFNSNRKEFAPTEDPFAKGKQNNMTDLPPLKAPVPLKFFFNIVRKFIPLKF